MRRVVVVELDDGFSDEEIERLQKDITAGLERVDSLMLIVEGARVHSMEVDDNE